MIKPEATFDSFSYQTRMGALIAGVLIATLVAGCAPSIKVTAPDKPIVVNMNVKIEHDLRVRLDKDVDKLIKRDQDIF